MNYEERKKEILEKLSAFSQSGYSRSEIRKEYDKLIGEMAGIAFNPEHSRAVPLRLYDLNCHFCEINQKNEGIADEELKTFEEYMMQISDWIDSYNSGLYGEKTVYRILREIPEVKVIRNPEYTIDGESTEIDDIVITKNGIVIVEVKNIKKELFIDSKGVLYSQGKYSKLLCNLGDRIKTRERIIRKIMSRAGFGNIPISSLVVFVQDLETYEITNICHKTIRTTRPTLLPGEIGRLKSDSEINVIRVHSELLKNEFPTVYPLPIDIPAFKEAFASLVAKLEYPPREKSSIAKKHWEGNDINTTMTCIKYAHTENTNAVVPDSNEKKHNKITTAMTVATASVVAICIAGLLKHRKEISSFIFKR